MDTMVATTGGWRPQNTTKAPLPPEGSLSVLATDPSVSTTSTNTTPFLSGYDWQRSTEENYRCESQSIGSSDGVFGEFQDFRRRLDRSYHRNYTPSRQIIQDTIIKSLLLRDSHCNELSRHSSTDVNTCVRDQKSSLPKEDASCSEEHNDTAPWIVFTAGVYGAGKSHTIGKLQALGCFPPKSSFVGVDPDEIRRMLPEFPLYRADQAGALTQKEAGMMAELLTDIALSSGKNVVVDGSLRDATWHEVYFRSLRARFGNVDQKDIEPKTKNIRIGILYVTAPIDEIYLRVEQRGVSTGRAIPPEFLERSMKEVPEAIERLRPLADFFLHVHNSQSKNQDDESQADSEQGSFASFVDDCNDKNIKVSEPQTKREEETLRKSDIEAIIFHEGCRSIAGY